MSKNDAKEKQLNSYANAGTIINSNEPVSSHNMSAGRFAQTNRDKVFTKDDFHAALEKVSRQVKPRQGKGKP